jgi:hypothetical protein
MSSNSTIRTIHFAQGVEITSSIVLDDAGELDLVNNQSALSTGLTFDLLVTREASFDYLIRRRTDTPYVAIERAVIRLTANPDGATDPEKWILSQEFKNNEGVVSGVTFTLSVTAGVATLMYATTNIAGANHHCYFNYLLSSKLI